MDCTYCPGNKPTCHLTKLINGQAVDVHVCEKCIPEITQPNLVDFDIWNAVAKLAEKKGKPDPGKAIEIEEDNEISPKSLLFNPGNMPTLQCPNCAFTTEDVRKTGRLGCYACYDIFEDLLYDVFNDCQKGLQHTGKTPREYMAFRREELEAELQAAVEEERFEDAAALRDQLARLK